MFKIRFFVKLLPVVANNRRYLLIASYQFLSYTEKNPTFGERP